MLVVVTGSTKHTQMNFRLLIKIVAISLATVFSYSCSKKHVELYLLDTIDVFVEVKNGKNLLFFGFVGGTNIDGTSIRTLVPINFKDSISVRIASKGVTKFYKSVKLKKGKFLYIENSLEGILIYSRKEMLLRI